MELHVFSLKKHIRSSTCGEQSEQVVCFSRMVAYLEPSKGWQMVPDGCQLEKSDLSESLAIAQMLRDLFEMICLLFTVYHCRQSHEIVI